MKPKYSSHILYVYHPSDNSFERHNSIDMHKKTLFPLPPCISILYSYYNKGSEQFCDTFYYDEFNKELTREEFDTIKLILMSN